MQNTPFSCKIPAPSSIKDEKASGDNIDIELTISGKIMCGHCWKENKIILSQPIKISTKITPLYDIYSEKPRTYLNNGYKSIFHRMYWYVRNFNRRKMFNKEDEEIKSQIAQLLELMGNPIASLQVISWKYSMSSKETLQDVKHWIKRYKEGKMAD